MSPTLRRPPSSLKIVGKEVTTHEEVRLLRLRVRELPVPLLHRHREEVMRRPRLGGAVPL